MPISHLPPRDRFPAIGVRTDDHGQGGAHSSIATLPPHSPFFWNDVIGRWNLVVKDWEAFAPSSSSSSSSTAAEAVFEMYRAIQHALVRNRSEITPAEVLSFTCGGLRFAFRAIGQAVPSGVVETLVGIMMDLTRAGLTGLYTVAFYFLKGSIIWSGAVVVLILWQNGREGDAQNLVT